MCKTARFRLLLALSLLAAGSTVLARFMPQPADQAPGDLKALRKGMGPDEVKKILGGEPARVSRQIFLHRALEQWHYGPPQHVRLVFDCPRGQRPVLMDWHKVAPVAP
jgi:hypothetical protein